MAEHQGGSVNFAETLRKHLKRVNRVGSRAEVISLMTVDKLLKPAGTVARITTAANLLGFSRLACFLNNMVFTMKAPAQNNIPAENARFISGDLCVYLR